SAAPAVRRASAAGGRRPSRSRSARPRGPDKICPVGNGLVELLAQPGQASEQRLGVVGRIGERLAVEFDVAPAGDAGRDEVDGLVVDVLGVELRLLAAAQALV